MNSIILNIKNFNDINEKIFYKLIIKENNQIYKTDKKELKHKKNQIDLPVKNNNFSKPFDSGAEIHIFTWVGNKSGESELKGYLFCQIDDFNIQEFETTLFKPSEIPLLLNTPIKCYAIGKKIKSETLIDYNGVPYGVGSEIIFPQRKYKIYVETDNGWVSFDGYTPLGREVVTLNIKITFNDGQEIIKKITFDSTSVVISNTEEIRLKNMKFDYAYFSPLYMNTFKPLLPVAIYISDNLELNYIDVFINETKTQSIEPSNEPIYDINISTAISFRENNIKLVFYCRDENKNSVVLEDTKRIYVSDEIHPELGIEYNADNGLYTANISSKQNELTNITHILWKIVFDAYVIQNIINIAGQDEYIKTDVLHDEIAKPNKTSLTFELKQIGRYNIYAYLVDKAGNFTKLHKEINSIHSTDETGEFSVGDKIPFQVISKNGKIPIYDLFVVSQDGFKKINTSAMTQLFDNVYGTEFTADINNCVYIMKIGKNIKFFRVGDNKNIVVSFSPNNTSDTSIDYILKSLDGKTIDKGKLKYGAEGIMYVVLNKNNHGIIKVKESYKMV